MIFCICNNVTEAELRAAAVDVAGDPGRLAAALGLYSEECCGRCAEEVESKDPLYRLPVGDY
jgi:bacterioferritin-associated ferredoxin